MASPSILLTSKPKSKVKSFTQAVKTNIIQQAARFAPVSSHKDFLCLLQLKEIFPNLPQAIIIFMHQTSLDSTNAFQRSVSCPNASSILKIMTYEPTR